MEARKTQIVLIYNGRDVTTDLLPFVGSVEYVDETDGKSDTIAVTLVDQDDRFVNSWYPDKGDRLELFFGYTDQLAPAGVFEIDETEYRGNPRELSIKGIAAPVSKSIRTRRSAAHEDSTLLKIAQSIASANNLTVSGTLDANLRIRRASQLYETDLAFLRRLANSYGYGFNVRAGSLVFYSYYDLEALPAKQTLRLADCISFAFREKTSQVYQSARAAYHNPDNQELVEAIQDGEDVEDVLEVRPTAKSAAEANEQARAALHKKNSEKVTGTLVCPGDVSLLAGNNILVPDAGKLSGLYHIVSSRHSVSPGGGYGTTIDIKRVGQISQG